MYGDVPEPAKHVLDEFFMREGINPGTFLEAIAEEITLGKKPRRSILERARRITWQRARRPKGQPE